MGRKSLFLLGISAFMFSACTYTIWLGEVTSALDSEATAFASVEVAQTERGEGPYRSLKTWRERLQTVKSSLANVVSDAADAEVAAASADELATLRGALDGFFAREVNVSLNIPSWHLNDAKWEVGVIEESYVDLANQYTAVYGAAPVRGTLSVVVVEDPNLVDTRPGCLDLMRDLAISFLDQGQGQEAEACNDAAVEFCSHQMDLTCFADRIKVYGGEGCHYQHCSTSSSSSCAWYYEEWIEREVRECEALVTK